MTVEQIIQILKAGSRNEIKIAKAELEKTWHANCRNEKLFIPFLAEMENFHSVKNIENRVAFLTALRWPFLSLGETHFFLCKDFVLRILQNESGQVRQAIISSAERLIPIFPLRFSEHQKVSRKRRRVIDGNELRFCELVEEVENLIREHDHPKFARYDYISSLPPSVYKSLQIFRSKLLRSEARENAYLEYRYEKDTQGLGKDDLPRLWPTQSERKWDHYYEGMECLSMEDTRMARMLFGKAIEMDEDFVAAYVGMTAVARTEGDSQQEKKYTKIAYEKTRKHFRNWPQEMYWGVLENRQYLRAICDRAILYQREGNLPDAERLYRSLLRLNPNDNQGVRYLIAGMFAGLAPEAVDRLMDKGNRLQNWDELERLVARQNARHYFWKEPEL